MVQKIVVDLKNVEERTEPQTERRKFGTFKFLSLVNK